MIDAYVQKGVGVGQKDFLLARLPDSSQTTEVLCLAHGLSRNNPPRNFNPGAVALPHLIEPVLVDREGRCYAAWSLQTGLGPP